MNKPLLNSHSRFLYVISDPDHPNTETQFVSRIEVVYFLDKLSEFCQQHADSPHLPKNVVITSYRVPYFSPPDSKEWNALQVSTISLESLMKRVPMKISSNASTNPAIEWMEKLSSSQRMKMPSKKRRNLRKKVSPVGLDGKVT